MRKYASAEERAAKNQKTTVRHFGFTEKVYGLPCTVRTMFNDCGSAIIGMSSCVFRFFLRGAIAVEARRRRAASASNKYYPEPDCCIETLLNSLGAVTQTFLGLISGVYANGMMR